MKRAVRIGSLDLRIFDDGMLKTSLDLLFDIDRSEAAELAGAQPDGSVFIPVNNFLFQREGATVLIDAGAGNTMQPTLGKLPDNLRAGGLSPEDVTHIVLTHLHPDHANGLVDDAGHAIYPNAEIVVLAREHDFWMSDDGAGDSEIVRKTRARNRVNLAPYRERLRLVRDGEEVLGCTALCAPGHSPGHTCWRVACGREALLAWGDLVHLSRVRDPAPRRGAELRSRQGRGQAEPPPRARHGGLGRPDDRRRACRSARPGTHCPQGSDVRPRACLTRRSARRGRPGPAFGGANVRAIVRPLHLAPCSPTFHQSEIRSD